MDEIDAPEVIDAPNAQQPVQQAQTEEPAAPQPPQPPPPTYTPSPTIPTNTPTPTWTLTPTWTPSATPSPVPATSTPIVFQAPEVAMMEETPLEVPLPPLEAQDPTEEIEEVTLNLTQEEPTDDEGGFQWRMLLPILIVVQVIGISWVLRQLWISK